MKSSHGSRQVRLAGIASALALTVGMVAGSTALAQDASPAASMAAMPETSWPANLDDVRRQELRAARDRGWATSHDEVIPGLRSVAALLTLPRGDLAAVAVVYLADPHSDEQIALRITAAASAIRGALGG